MLRRRARKDPPGQPGTATTGLDGEYRSRERDDDRCTRKPLALWDRVKFVLLLAGLWGILLANTSRRTRSWPGTTR